MNLEEIKNLFNVDLRQPNRNRMFVIVKNIYVNQERLKGYTFQQIASKLNMETSSIILCYQRTSKFETYFNYANIKTAFENKDSQLYGLQQKAYLFRIINGIKKPKKDKEEVTELLDMIPHPKRRWSYLRIIETLRKHNKHPLWNKPIPNFTFRDYKILKSL